jgi:hypothetical protein
MLWSKFLPITIGLLLISAAANAEPALPGFGARLSGFQETPSIFSPATGTFEATIDVGKQEISYTLTYSGLSAPVTVAHIHFAQKHVAGAIIAFLCGGGGKPACPTSPGQAEGDVTAANVIGPAGQGIAAGEFAEAIRAMRAGYAYANVHTATYPSGEIRGQINSHSGEKRHN